MAGISYNMAAINNQSSGHRGINEKHQKAKSM